MSYSPFFFNKSATGTVSGSRGTTTNFMNGSGSSLAKATLVAVNSSSQLIPVSVTNESTVGKIVGMTGMSIPNAAIGSVVDNGRLEDVSLLFTIGTALYLGKDGNLTSEKPDYGGVGGWAAGDFIIFIGVVVQNEFNPSLKDIKLMISVIGQL